MIDVPMLMLPFMEPGANAWVYTHQFAEAVDGDCKCYNQLVTDSSNCKTCDDSVCVCVTCQEAVRNARIGMKCIAKENDTQNNRNSFLRDTTYLDYSLV